MLVLLEHGYKVCIMDNLDNSFQKAYDRMVELAGDKAPNMKFIKVGRGPGGWAQVAPLPARPLPPGGMTALLHLWWQAPAAAHPAGRPAQPGGPGEGVFGREVSGGAGLAKPPSEEGSSGQLGGGWRLSSVALRTAGPPRWKPCNTELQAVAVVRPHWSGCCPALQAVGCLACRATMPRLLCRSPTRPQV